MLLVLLVGSLALQVWAWRTISKRIEWGGMTKLQGAARYAFWAFLPLLVFVGIFFGAVGVEEWLGVALISEPVARGTPLVALLLFTLSGLGWLGFAVRSAFLHKPRAPREEA